MSTVISLRFAFRWRKSTMISFFGVTTRILADKLIVRTDGNKIVKMINHLARANLLLTEQLEWNVDRCSKQTHIPPISIAPHKHHEIDATRDRVWKPVLISTLHTNLFSTNSSICIRVGFPEVLVFCSIRLSFYFVRFFFQSKTMEMDAIFKHKILFNSDE